MRINIAICDDDTIELSYLRSVVLDWAKNAGESAIVSVYDSAEAFLFNTDNDIMPDIVLLDIQMKAMNGIELAKHLRNSNEDVQIIFITGLPDFIAEGYEVSALHYLMKPLHPMKLAAVMDKACERLGRPEPTLLLDSGGATMRILQKDIQLIESLAYAVSIKTSGRIYESKTTLKVLESMLDHASFIRCHRSFIIGIRYIKSITHTDVILDDGQVIPLSRRLYHDVIRSFITYYQGDA